MDNLSFPENIRRLTGLVGATSFIVGYDIGISGGLTSTLIYLKKLYPTLYENDNQGSSNKYFKVNNYELTLSTSSFYLAAAIALSAASRVTRDQGAKSSMRIGGCLYFVGSIIAAVACKGPLLILGRLLMGLGVGFTNQAATMYILETTPYKYRGKYYMYVPSSITNGISVSYLANLVAKGMEHNNGLRLILGVGAFFAFFHNIMFTFLFPDTPMSLVGRNKLDEARSTLTKIRNSREEADQEFDHIVAANMKLKKMNDPQLSLLKQKYRPCFIIMLYIPFFQQLAGMNAFMFYVPVLIKTMVNIESWGKLSPAFMLCGVNMIAIAFTALILEKTGRRRLLIVGGGLMFLSQIVITLGMASKLGIDEDLGEPPKLYVAISMCLYVLAFVCTWGPLGWLVPSEILPLEIRSTGQSFNVRVIMLYTFFGTKIFLHMMCEMRFGTLVFFSIFGFFMICFVYFFVPETNGIPNKDMQEIWKAHPYWKQYVCDEASYQKDFETSTTKTAKRVFP